MIAWMKRRWILVILTVLFFWAIISQFAGLKQLGATLAKGRWSLILAAVLSQVVYFTIFSSIFQAAFQTVGIKTRTRDLILVTLGSLFVNTVVPFAGAGGIALFAEEMNRKGQPATQAALGVLLQQVANTSAFTLVLVPGLSYLSLKQSLEGYEIIVALLLLLLTASTGAVLTLGRWKPAWLHRLFGWIQQKAIWLYGRLHRTISLPEDWARKNADGYIQASTAVAAHPWLVVKTIAVALVAHSVDIATIYILFLAFNEPVNLGILVAGYTIGILFWIITIIPQGIGVVEGMMALTFTSLGIPAAVSALVALSFRGLTFWLPMFIGYIAVQRMQSLREP